MKKLLLQLFLLSFTSVIFAAQSAVGFWETINEDTHKPQSIIAIYKYQNMYYGRIIATFGTNGKIKESIYDPQGRAPGVVGNPYYCGLDIIYNLSLQGKNYAGGKIMDPEQGKIYKVLMWLEGGNLVVRGKLLMFGRNQTWIPAKDADFPKGFKKPDLTTMVPNIPKVKD